MSWASDGVAAVAAEGVGGAADAYLSVENVTVEFPGVKALDGVSFSAGPAKCTP